MFINHRRKLVARRRRGKKGRVTQYGFLLRFKSILVSFCAGEPHALGLCLFFMDLCSVLLQLPQRLHPNAVFCSQEGT